MHTDSINATSSSAIDLMLRRASALKLSEPGPSREQIETMLKAAVTAADHGRIRPWRFVVIQGEGRVRLSRLMGAVHSAINPNAKEGDLEKAQAKAFRAPLIIALVCQADATQKVSILEQQFAAAAAGAQLMLAANALGFGVNWKTGSASEHSLMREGLGFGKNDVVIGFFYIGTEPQSSPLPRASTESVVQYWT